MKGVREGKQTLQWGRFGEGSRPGEGQEEGSKGDSAKNGSQGAARHHCRNPVTKGEHAEMCRTWARHPVCAGQLGAVLLSKTRVCKHQNSIDQRKMRSQQAGNVLPPTSQSDSLK